MNVLRSLLYPTVTTLAVTADVGCGSEGCDAIACGDPLSVRFEPPIEVDAAGLQFEATYDGTTRSCTATASETICEHGDVSLEIDRSNGNAVRLDIHPAAGQLRVRVLRNGTVVRDGEFTPVYRNVALNECTTCKRVEVVLDVAQ